MKKPDIRFIEVKKKELNLDDWKLRTAVDEDYKTLYKETVGLVVDGRVVVMYIDLDKLGIDATAMTNALNKIEYHVSERTAGLKTTSRIFGYAPRNTLRKDFCSATTLAKDFPKEHQIICDYAKQIDEIYHLIDPDTYNKHAGESKKVLKDWCIEDTVFTSGIVNKNNPLKYHFDTGNFKNVYSCMLGFKYNIKGGYLATPEYDCAFEIKQNSLHIFDGQNILHGVTPITKLTEDAWRYTIVYYSLKSMWSCLPLGAELERIQTIKTQRERKRAASGEAEEVVDEKEAEFEEFKKIR